MKEILLKKVGIGFLLYIVFNFVLFGVASVFGFSDENTGPTLASSLVFASLMGLAVFGLLKLVKPIDQKSAFIYSTTWTAVVTAVLLAVTLANGTTNLIFGVWYNYLPLLAMALVPVILKDKK